MATVEMTAAAAFEKSRVSVDQYRQFREQGFLVIKGLFPPDDVREVNEYMDDMLALQSMLSFQQPGQPR